MPTASPLFKWIWSEADSEWDLLMATYGYHGIVVVQFSYNVLIQGHSLSIMNTMYNEWRGVSLWPLISMRDSHYGGAIQMTLLFFTAHARAGSPFNNNDDGHDTYQWNCISWPIVPEQRVNQSCMHARIDLEYRCNVHKYVYRWRYIHLEDLISTYQHHCRILISTHTYLHPVYIHQPADRAQLHTTTDLEHMMIRLVFTTRTASSSMPTRQYNDMPHDYLVNNPNSSTNSNSGRRMQWYSYSCYPRTIYAGHIPQPQLIFRNREGTYHGGFVVSEDNFGYARYYYCGNPYFFAAVSEHSIVDDHRAGPIRQNSNNYISGQRTQTQMQMQSKHRPLDRTPPPPPPIIGTTLE